VKNVAVERRVKLPDTNTKAWIAMAFVGVIMVSLATLSVFGLSY
jgi:LPXTG-motif cell wall-anchored protein